MKAIETNIFCFLCVASIFKWLSDSWNQFFLATMQALKSGACGGPFQKSHRKYLFEQPGAFLFAINIKQNYIEKISVKKNKTKSGPCLEISCATIFQPRIPAHLIWCILHTGCTLFPGTDLKYNPPPYLRKLTVCVCACCVLIPWEDKGNSYAWLCETLRVSVLCVNYVYLSCATMCIMFRVFGVSGVCVRVCSCQLRSTSAFPFQAREGSSHVH